MTLKKRGNLQGPKIQKKLEVCKIETREKSARCKIKSNNVGANFERSTLKKVKIMRQRCTKYRRTQVLSGSLFP